MNQIVETFINRGIRTRRSKAFTNEQTDINRIEWSETRWIQKWELEVNWIDVNDDEREWIDNWWIEELDLIERSNYFWIEGINESVEW